MPFAASPLADGQVPSTKGTVYTVPASTTAYVYNMRLCNTNAVAQDVDVWVNVSGTSRQIGRFSLAQYESADVFTQPFHLSAGDLIEADTITASAVDYVITGVLET
jgi:hypothetical protein